MRIFIQDTQLAVDTGTVSTVTTGVEIDSKRYLSFHVTTDTGTIDGLVLTVQHSLDNVNWFSSSDTLTITSATEGYKQGITCDTKYVRLKVTTKSSIASTGDIILQAK